MLKEDDRLCLSDEGGRPLGSVAVGKEASRTVFSKNILTVADTEIMSTEVEKAMFRGTWLK